MPRALETLSVHRLGRASYAETHALQQRLVEARVRGDIGDVLLLVEHDPVVTLGRAAAESNILFSRELLAAQGVEVHETGRGGDVTYHGPGQVVAYPIVDLSPDRQDVRKYVASLEDAMIRTCAEYELVASRIAGMNGTWIGHRKVGAVGVRISRWVTMHGLALNVSTNLAHFGLIVPCGIRDKGVTSLLEELGERAPSWDEAATHIATHFAAQYEAALSFHEGAPALPALPAMPVPPECEA